MIREAEHPRSALDAWLSEGADRLDPIRLQRMRALERRAAAQDGEVRRLLDERLQALAATYAADVRSNAFPAAPTPTRTSAAPASAARPRTALTSLIEHMAAGAPSQAAGGGDAFAPPSRLDSAVLDDLMQVCAGIRTESQLRQALTPASADAGPLNSASLVHRALTLMRDLSPDYLAHFISYVDALSGLEPVCARATPLAENAPRATRSTKPARARPRRRPV